MGTTPTIWLQEFSQIPQQLRVTMLTDRYAITHIQKYYKDRCQHAEDTNQVCEGCDVVRSDYRKGRIKYVMQEIQESAEARNEMLKKSVMIWSGNEWHNVHEADESVHNIDDVICIFWNDPHLRFQTLRQMGLTRNVELETLINRIHGTE